MNSDTTLQINLSPGDSHYAAVTVPRLIEQHKDEVDEVLLIVDCNRPGETRIVDPEERFPDFEQRRKDILDIVTTLCSQYPMIRVETLEPANALYKAIARKYLRDITTSTHDYGGCALMAYLAAFELASHRYLLHYDADMILFQQKGLSWIGLGRERLANDTSIAAITPRIAPPDPELKERPSHHEWPSYEKDDDGWRDSWFSTRCFLFDRDTLQNTLPLLQGGRYLRNLFRRTIGRGFPESPEVMISTRMTQCGLKRLQLMANEAWLLHPIQKDLSFIEALPDILERIDRDDIPEGQRGLPDLKMNLWA